MISIGEIVCQKCSGKLVKEFFLVKEGWYALCTKCGAKWIIESNANGSFKSMRSDDGLKMNKNLDPKPIDRQTDCLLNKPHASSVEIERRLAEKCRCLIHRKTEKKEPSRCCACRKSIDDQNAVYFSNRNWICDSCINIVCSEWFEDYLEWKEEKRDSGGEKELGLPKRHSHGKSEGNSPLLNSKLPRLICPFCGRKLIRYKQAWICDHGCTKPALKPEEKLPEPIKACFNCYYFKISSKCQNRHAYSYKEFFYTTIKTGICNNWRPKKKTEPEKEFEFQLVEKFIPPRNIKCTDCMNNPVPKLIEGFIKFIDHFEERYEGNKCGECLEYWKIIKEHYKGA